MTGSGGHHQQHCSSLLDCQEVSCDKLLAGHTLARTRYDYFRAQLGGHKCDRDTEVATIYPVLLQGRMS